MAIDPSPSSPLVATGEIEKLQALIKRYAGLRVDARKLEYSLQRAWPTLSAMGVQDVPALVRELSFFAGRTWAAFLPFLTINETYFLRESKQLEFFLAHGLADLQARAARRGSLALNVLSAACSTGEEPYTLAVLLADAGVRSRVLGVDIDPEALRKAEAALYPPNAFRGVDPAWRDRHFDPLAPEQWWVKAPYRELVQFRRANLLHAETELAGRQFDAIFCRNVLIYFDRETQLRVIHQLGRLLVPGGCLFLGHSELFFDMDLGLTAVSTPHATMYRREDP